MSNANAPTPGGGRRAPRLIANEAKWSWLVNAFNKLAEFAESCAIGPGVNYHYHSGPGGTTLVIGPGGTSGSSAHNYQVYNASKGSTPKVRVRPGNHFGGPSSRTKIPTIDGTPINVKTGSPPNYPALTVGESHLYVWFKINIDEDGDMSSIEIQSGTSVPEGTDTEFYQLCGQIEVTIKNGIASVKCLEGGVAGSQAYQRCGDVNEIGLQ